MEKTKRVYLKKKYIEEKVNELVDDLKEQLNERLRILRLQEDANRLQLREIDDMKDKLHVKVTRFLQQESIENGMKRNLEALVKNIDSIELDIAHWRTEGKKFYKIGTRR